MDLFIANRGNNEKCLRNEAELNDSVIVSCGHIFAIWKNLENSDNIESLIFVNAHRVKSAVFDRIKSALYS